LVAVGNRRSSPHAVKTITIEEVCDDSSTNTTNTNNNSTPIVELLKKQQAQANTKPAGSNKGNSNSPPKKCPTHYEETCFSSSIY
jgi:hypothetical protein